MTKYWVGGGSSANWDATANTNWGSASSLRDNTAVPTDADDCIFDNSANGNSPCTINGSPVCRSIDASAYTNTITHNAATTLTIGDGTAGTGNKALDFGAFTYTKNDNATSAIKFASTSTTVQSVNFNSSGASRNSGNVTFDGVAGSWQLTGAMTATTTATVTLTNGTLDTNGQTCSWGLFAIQAGTKTLTLGASAITITGTGTPWNVTTTTNLTFNPNTSSITLTGSSGSGTITFTGAGTTYNNVSFVPTVASNFQLNGGTTFANLTFTGASGVGHSKFNQAGNSTITGTLTLTGTDSATDAGRIFVDTSVSGTVRTITAATVTLTNVDFRLITAAGAASPFTGTSLGNANGNSNITFTAAVTRYWVGNGGNWRNFGSHWASTSGGSAGASMPLAQDTAVFDAASFSSASQTITNTGNPGNMRILCGDLDFSNVDSTPAFDPLGGTTTTICGSLTLGASMTWTSRDINTYFGLLGTSSTITTNGITIRGGFNTDYLSSYTLLDNLTGLSTFVTARGFILNGGTFDANGNNVSLANIDLRNSTVARTLTMGSGTWTISGVNLASTGVWEATSPTNLTINANTSTIAITDTSATNKTFAGGGKTYNNLTITGSGTGKVDFTGANTFNVFTINAPKTVRFTAATTTTFTTFVATGTAGNVITISSITAATHTLSKYSGIVSCNYLDLTNSIATGGANWYAGANSTDSGGNTGWSFTTPGSFLGTYRSLTGTGK